jgi:hypothetical protein
MGLWATNSNVGDIFGLHVSSLLLDKVGWYVILWVLAGAGMDSRGGNGNQSDPVLPHYLFLIIEWASALVPPTPPIWGFKGLKAGNGAF